MYKSVATIFLSIILIASGNAQTEPLDPKEQDHKKTSVLNATLEPVSAEEDTAFIKEVFITDEGVYQVVLKDSLGNVRCEGFSRDEEGKIKHGKFTYYYPNGNIESKGEFENNVKIGEWKRWTADNQPKKSKFYSERRKEKLEELTEDE